MSQFLLSLAMLRFFECCDLNSLQASKPDWRWQLTASGRFAHRKEYVQEVGEKYGLKIFHYEKMDGFRFEGGVAVRGHIFVLHKQATDLEL